MTEHNQKSRAAAVEWLGPRWLLAAPVKRLTTAPTGRALEQQFASRLSRPRGRE